MKIIQPFKGLLVIFVFVGTFTFFSESVSAATMTVNSVADTVVANASCTLREAILNANANATTHAECAPTGAYGVDTIEFSITGGTPHSILLTSSLPTITDPIIIDGESEPDATCGTLVPSLPAASNTTHTLSVVINGTSAGSANNLTLGAGSAGSTIRGLVIRNAQNGGSFGYGIAILDASTGGHTIECNYIGTGLTGNASQPNEASGIGLEGADSNIIRNNLISANAVGGILISGTSTDNTIFDNIIGLNSSGTVDLGNTVNGVGIIDGSSSNTIRDNVISGNNNDGIEVTPLGGPNPNSQIITGNFIGTSLTGTVDIGNSGYGVRLDTNTNTVGGSTSTLRNLISGNDSYGVSLGGDSNDIFGNYIGTDTTGLTFVRNSGGGIRVDGTDNEIGNTTVGNRNIISGNDSDGIDLFEGGNSIVNNWIGVDSTGNGALGNLTDGIRNATIVSNTIGGPTDAHRNVISANGDDGIQLDSGLPSGNAIIQRNWIGVSADGTIPLGHNERCVEVGFHDVGGNLFQENVCAASGENGIVLVGLGSSGDTFIGNYIGTNTDGEVIPGFGNTEAGIEANSGSPHLIGGTSSSDSNIIAGNGAGIIVNNVGGFTIAPNVTILGNSIYDNEGGADTSLGIDLVNNTVGYGVNLNDSGDSDAGGNDFLNFIEPSSAFTIGTTQTVNFNLDVPAGDYRIEFFANDSEDPSGYGEGQDFLDSETITHTGSGQESFTVTFFNPDSSRVLSSTVTQDFGGGDYGVTSEFSNIFQANFEGISDGNTPPEDEELADTGTNVVLGTILGATLLGLTAYATKSSLPIYFVGRPIRKLFGVRFRG